jgi:hypothetical protein
MSVESEHLDVTERYAFRTSSEPERNGGGHVVSVRARWSSFAGSIQGQPLGSLRRKIIIWSFVPTAIILIAVAFIDFQAYRQATEDLVIERDRELTRLWANQLGTKLHVYSDPLTAWARTAFVYEGDSTALSDALRRARSSPHV